MIRNLFLMWDERYDAFQVRTSDCPHCCELKNELAKQIALGLLERYHTVTFRAIDSEKSELCAYDRWDRRRHTAQVIIEQ